MNDLTNYTVTYEMEGGISIGEAVSNIPPFVPRENEVMKFIDSTTGGVLTGRVSNISHVVTEGSWSIIVRLRQLE